MVRVVTFLGSVVNTPSHHQISNQSVRDVRAPIWERTVLPVRRLDLLIFRVVIHLSKGRLYDRKSGQSLPALLGSAEEVGQSGDHTVSVGKFLPRMKVSRLGPVEAVILVRLFYLRLVQTSNH